MEHKLFIDWYCMRRCYEMALRDGVMKRCYETVLRDGAMRWCYEMVL